MNDSLSIVLRAKYDVNAQYGSLADMKGIYLHAELLVVGDGSDDETTLSVIT